MLKAISHETPADFDSLLRTSYMTIVTAAADELGVAGVQYVDQFDSVEQDVREFTRVVTGVVAKFRLRSSSGRVGRSVRLASRTKGIIESELSKLRDVVSNSQLEDVKKRKLLGKIEEFRTELHKERLGYGVAFSALVFLAAGVGGTTAFLADVPNAVTTIMHLIGQDKEKEEAEVLRLEGPPKPNLLADHTRAPSGKMSRHMDDDIPF
ncbi:hypothetical protein [Rhizobium sp. BR 314]|uniref:hypothetical protein n=1 Tax=Rhizobium sp. BR 314 TaxID=3040013 RepID=UPI0039BF1D9B